MKGSLTATMLTSSREMLGDCQRSVKLSMYAWTHALRKTIRPMRPKPLIPTCRCCQSSPILVLLFLLSGRRRQQRTLAGMIVRIELATVSLRRESTWKTHFELFVVREVGGRKNLKKWLRLWEGSNKQGGGFLAGLFRELTHAALQNTSARLPVE